MGELAKKLSLNQNIKNKRTKDGKIVLYLTGFGEVTRHTTRISSSITLVMRFIFLILS